MKTRFVCLLRGINVGGNNIIKMADLKLCFEGEGFEKVSTFIASGNVLFEAAGAAAKLTSGLEQTLSKRFEYGSRVVLRSAAEMKAVIEAAPKGFGKEPAKYKYDAFFVKEPRTAADVVAALNPKEGVDRVWAGDGVVYTSRLIAKASQSRLGKVASSPVYQDITIRNWNTTQKLAALLSSA